MMDQNDNKLSLSNIYASIIQQTSSMIKPWPDSDGFAKCCLDSSALSAAAEENTNATTTSSSKNSFQVPTFPEGTGPLGVFALTRENTHPGNEKLVQTCLDAFDQFCEELNAIATTLQHNNNSNNDDDDENNHKGDDDELFFWVKSLVPHITIAIFQEHPQLLPKMTQEELDEFYFFTNDDGDKLAQSLAKQTFRYSPIQLTLDSLILTPDGAMIAGFVDDDDNNNDDDDGGVGNNYYDKLKTDIVTDAKQVMGMGEFTSRPKNLIHITCGRVVRKQGAALELSNTSTQADIQKLVERYNKQVFPQLVADMKGNDNGGTLLLEQLTLLRNDVWLCEKNTVYGVGKLQGPDDSKSVS
ncbi:unnamed protein product [Cylindrotheca closterium]|uniref:Uncharacterized protein n=1 Tax=Cylindrotheca closterium TaxID=2856 RepID=A0AAD2JNS7_9STRA|nr:unnamed protein product [Cylindrotheca closterium]